MKNQIFKFRCRLIRKEGLFKREHIVEDFEYVIAGHHYVSTALDEVKKYVKEQFGQWPMQYDNEDMISDIYWSIKLINVGDRKL